MVARKGRTGNPGQKNPLKRNATTFKVESGKEARSEKPICFRPTVSLEVVVNAAVASSGLNKTQLIETALITYLKQNSEYLNIDQVVREYLYEAEN